MADTWSLDVDHTGRRRSLDRVDALRALVEGLLVVAAYWSFTHIQDMLGHDAARAEEDAVRLQAIEARWHLALEEPVNHWVATHTMVAGLASVVYPGLLVLVPVTLLLVAVRRIDLYPLFRTRLVVLSFTSLVVFAALPVSPPRLAQAGIVDVVVEYSPMAALMEPSSTQRGDLYAAMPSLHVAWALWCGMALRAAFGRTHPVLATAWLLLPVVVALDVLGTGNHYVLDVLAGLALTTVTTLVVRRGRPLWDPRH